MICRQLKSGLFTTFALAVLLIGCGREDHPGDTSGKTVLQKIIPDREGWDATIRISSNGVLQAIIEYGHMTYFESRQINYFDDGVRVDMFDNMGQHTTRLTADSGRYQENTQNIWAIGQVVVVSDTGVVLKTPRLKWDQSIEKILSDTTVMVTTTAKDTIYGTAFSSDPDLTHMVIENPSGSRQEGIDFDRLENEMAEPDSGGTGS